MLRHRSLRQELQLTLGCRRWKRELWGFHTHRRRLELRLRRCRQELRTSRWSGLGSAGTLAGGSSSVPGGEVGSVNNNGNNNNNWGEVGCVRQTISSHCDGYRQLRCLLDLRQDEPISQNPPDIACHPTSQLVTNTAVFVGRKGGVGTWQIFY